MSKENKETSLDNQMPWQFSTTGLVIGFIIGIIPFIIALVGNYQYKCGYETNELRQVYNIFIIIIGALIGLIFISLILALLLALTLSF